MRKQGVFWTSCKYDTTIFKASSLVLMEFQSNAQKNFLTEFIINCKGLPSMPERVPSS